MTAVADAIARGLAALARHRAQGGKNAGLQPDQALLLRQLQRLLVGIRGSRAGACAASCANSAAG